MRVVAVFSKFPNVDETPILREVSAVKAGGADVYILSLKSSTDAVVQDRAKPLLGFTTYLPWLSFEVVSSIAGWLWRKPGTVAALVLFVLRGLQRSPKETVINLAVIGKSMVYARRMRRIGVDYVHGFWATYAATSAKTIGELLGVPWGMSAHAHDIYRGNALLDEKVRQARLVLTCTAENEVYLTKRVPEAAGKIVFLRHGLDLSHFHPTPPLPGDRPLRVLCVGSLVYRKGQHLLLKALTGLTRDGIEWELTLVGDDATAVSTSRSGAVVRLVTDTVIDPAPVDSTTSGAATVTAMSFIEPPPGSRDTSRTAAQGCRRRCRTSA